MAHLYALVVDDSGAMRKQLAYAIERIPGLSAVEAADGAEAWRMLSTSAFDVILTDINMPVLDGLKLLALVRGAKGQKRTPVVVITTEGGEPDRRRAMTLGADAYLVKPVQASQVVETVKSLLHLSG
jgi:two-component system chemotaxis response regulator CheY